MTHLEVSKPGYMGDKSGGQSYGGERDRVSKVPGKHCQAWEVSE